MKRLGAALAVAFAVAALVWFTWYAVTEPDSGTVTGKHYRGSYLSTSCYGHPVHCHSTYHGECYRVTYRATNGRSGDDCVSPGEYDRIKKGDHYSR